MDYVDVINLCGYLLWPFVIVLGVVGLASLMKGQEYMHKSIAQQRVYEVPIGKALKWVYTIWCIVTEYDDPTSGMSRMHRGSGRHN